MISIVLFSLNYLDIGGVETHLRSVIEHGKEAEIKFFVVGYFSESMEKQVTEAGGEAIPWAENIVNLKGLIKFIKTRRIDLLHIHSHRGSILARLAAFICQIPAVTTVHLSLLDHLRDSPSLAQKGKTLVAIIGDTLFNHIFSKRIIFVSGSALNQVTSFSLAPKSKSTAIPNGINMDRFGVFNDVSKDQKILKLVFVGRLHHQKGLDILFQALALQKEKQETSPLMRTSEVPSDQIHVQIIGSGSEEYSLRQLACDLEISATVQFLGEKSATEIPYLLASSDIFILPSRFEAMPYALLEAMAAGLPSIVSNVGENSWMIQGNRCGLTIQPEDPEELAKAIALLASSPKLRSQMSIRARKRARDFSDQKMLARLFSVYLALLN